MKVLKNDGVYNANDGIASFSIASVSEVNGSSLGVVSCNAVDGIYTNVNDGIASFSVVSVSEVDDSSFRIARAKTSIALTTTALVPIIALRPLVYPGQAPRTPYSARHSRTCSMIVLVVASSPTTATLSPPQPNTHTPTRAPFPTHPP